MSCPGDESSGWLVRRVMSAPGDESTVMNPPVMSPPGDELAGNPKFVNRNAFYID